jgi:hypothetical protein
MATVFESSPSARQHERLFFFIMALAIIVTVVPSFWMFHQAGFSSFSSPWWVHVHAFTFMGWIGFYMVQNSLVLRGSVGVHQRLGRIGAVYAVWMVLVGLALTPMTLAAGRSPPFFTPPYFLALDWVNILFFAGLIAAALKNRQRSDWHKRLMLCATICVMAPAWGRIIVLSGHTMTAPVNIAVLLPYVAVGMVFDLATRRRIHPAWLWGFGALVAMAALIEVVARIPAFVELGSRIAG